MGEPVQLEPVPSPMEPPIFSPPPRHSSIRSLLPFIVFVILVVVFAQPIKNAIVHFFEFETTDDASIWSHSAILSSKVPGVVLKVNFEDHAIVKKGDVLVQLDDREFLNAIKQLQADLSAATAIYYLAKSDLDRGEFDNVVKQRQNELDSAAALLNEAKIDLDRGEFDTIVNRRRRELESGTALLNEATQTLRRMEELKSKKLISDEEFDNAKTNFDNNVGKVGALEIQLKEAELSAQRAQEAAEAKFRNLESKHRANKVQVREGQRAAGSAYDAALSNYRASLARIWSIQAQLDQARLNLEYTQIRAPDNGTVSTRSVEPGMVIKPNQPLTTFFNSNEKWVVADFKETQLKNIYVGQPVEIEVDAIEGKIFEGTVQSISPGSGSVFALIPPDNATGNFTKIVQRVPVKIAFKRESIAGSESQLIPGISVYVKARIRNRGQANQ